MTATAASNAGTLSPSSPAAPVADPTEEELAVSRRGGGAPLSRSGVLFFAPTPPLGRRPPLQAKNPASERGTPPPLLTPAEQPFASPCGAPANRAGNPPESCAA